MQSTVIHFLEMMVGAILLALGIIYLTIQAKSIEQMNNLISNHLMENEEIFQQENDNDINRISDGELYAIIMGYREYPIMIDGNLIEPEGTEYEKYLSYIQEGYYIKSYLFDSFHYIKQLVFTHI